MNEKNSVEDETQSSEVWETSELFHEQRLFFQDKKQQRGYNLTVTTPINHDDAF